MPANFQTSIQFVLKNEAGFVDNDNDKGGPTNMGITAGTLSAWRGGKPISTLDMKNLTLAEAEAVYAEKYWKLLKLDQVENQEIATMMFDAAVNHGPGHAVMAIQQSVGVHADGIIGEETLAAINAADPRKAKQGFVIAVQMRYADIVKHNPTQSEFIGGWLARTHKYFAFL